MNPKIPNSKSTNFANPITMMNLKAFRSKVALSSLVATLGVSAAVSAAMPVGAVSVNPPPVSFGFGCITNNKAADCAIGESQLKTTVSQYSPTQVLFQFFNIGTFASSITDIYFEDTLPNSLKGIAQIFNYTGVEFAEGANPQNLPSGKQVSFNATFGADSNSPTQPNGVNPGETVGILFNVKEEYANDAFNAVVTDLQTGSLRVGVHVQGYAGGGSESFVNEAVPEPLTMLGSGLALGIGGLFQRKMSKLQKKKS